MEGLWEEDNESRVVLPRRTIYEILQSKPIKLELGGGAKPVGGHINVDLKDIPEVDFVADISTLEDFPDGSVDAILARDVIQCFHREELVTVLRRWFRKLRRGSRFTVRVPDMQAVFKLYADKKVCHCWNAAIKSAEHDCAKCNGLAVMNYDKFQTYLYGRNRENELFKSIYDFADLSTLIEKAGFTITENSTKDLRILIVAKKVVIK